MMISVKAVVSGTGSVYNIGTDPDPNPGEPII